MRKISEIITICTTLILITGFSMVQANGDYEIQGGDRLMVEVMDHSELTRNVIVRPDGKISFPLIGDVYARGFTVEHLEDVLAEKLSEYIKGIHVTVYVQEFFFNHVLILGAVKNPGPLQIFGPVDVIQILGITESIDREPKKVRIIRKDGDVKTVSLTSVWRQGGTIQHREDLLLYPGDTLIVYENSKITWTMIYRTIIIITFLMTLYNFTNQVTQ
jgi:polysaccharide export outer membrane protein